MCKNKAQNSLTKITQTYRYICHAASNARSASIRPVATDVAHSVVCVSVCLYVCMYVMGRRVSCAKSGWTDRDSVWGSDSCVLDRDKVGRVHSPPWGVTRRLCSLLPNYFWTLSYKRFINVTNSKYGWIISRFHDNCTVRKSRLLSVHISASLKWAAQHGKLETVLPEAIE